MYETGISVFCYVSCSHGLACMASVSYWWRPGRSVYIQSYLTTRPPFPRAVRLQLPSGSVVWGGGGRKSWNLSPVWVESCHHSADTASISMKLFRPPKYQSRE